MWKSQTFCILVLLLFGSFDFFTVEKGADAALTKDTAWCKMPQACDVTDFTDWFKVGNYCVKYFETPLSFTDAEFSCNEKESDGHLVSVHNKDDNDLLLCMVIEFHRGNLRTWLGGFRLLKTDKFLWLDGTKWDYTFWKSGEPNHEYTKEECTEMNWNSTGEWNDESCWVKKSYICAFKPKKVLEEGLK